LITRHIALLYRCSSLSRKNCKWFVLLDFTEYCFVSNFVHEVPIRLRLPKRLSVCSFQIIFCGCEWNWVY
jgi:hypothetical protein